MYKLETSTGYQLQTTTVQAMTSALMQQLQKVGEQDFSWTVCTPHGTALTDAAAHSEPDAAEPVLGRTRAETAYAILVRDHLLNASADDHDGLLLTSRG